MWDSWQDFMSDATAVLSAAAVIYGVYLIHEPSAFIVGGMACLTATLLRARRGYNNGTRK